MSNKAGPRSANPVDVHVGSRVRVRRKVLKMSQEKLGDALGVTFQQVQKYERGSNRIGASRLYKLSEILEVPIGFFYEGLSGNHFDQAVAEDHQMPLVYDFIKSSDGIALATAVSQIKSKAVRRRILDLARSLAEDAKNEEE